MTSYPMHNFAGRRAAVLCRSEEPMRRVAERCGQLGIQTLPRQDAPGPAIAERADMVILDIDTGHDGQLPWAPGQASLPLIGLLGSESPGRLAWALGQEIDAYLPLSALGTLFSALVIAHETFSRKAERRRREAAAAGRRSGRLDVIRAVLLLMGEGGDEALALKQLRAMAMVEQIPLEAAARRLLAAGEVRRAGEAR